MSDKKTEVAEDTEDKKSTSKLPKKKKEIGGTDGPEPTRFGDWEKRELPQTSKSGDFYDPNLFS